VFAMWLARSPIANDLSCGFQANLSSGTRSSTRRVASISRSYSGSSSSAIVITVAPLNAYSIYDRIDEPAIGVAVAKNAVHRAVAQRDVPFVSVPVGLAGR